MNSQPPTPKEPPTPNNTPKPYDIRERTFLFALRILEITEALLEIPAARTVRNQLSDAGASVEANVEETDGAVSRAEKRRILIIARREARETRYWLRIVERNWPHLRVQADIVEATELLYILSAMIEKLG